MPRLPPGLRAAAGGSAHGGHRGHLKGARAACLVRCLKTHRAPALLMQAPALDSYAGGVAAAADLRAAATCIPWNRDPMPPPFRMGAAVASGGGRCCGFAVPCRTCLPLLRPTLHGALHRMLWGCGLPAGRQAGRAPGSAPGLRPAMRRSPVTRCAAAAQQAQHLPPGRVLQSRSYSH